MARTGAQWISETRDYLDGDRSEVGNQLDTAYVDGSGELTLRYRAPTVAPGTILGMGLNTLRVLAVNPLSQTVSVIGGQAGSFDRPADPGSLVRVNPRFTDFQVFNALNRHLRSLSSPRVGLFQVATIEVDYMPWVQSYGLPFTDRLIRVLDVRRQTIGPDLSWPSVTPGMWEVIHNPSLDDFVDGRAIRVLEGDAGRAIQVVYAAEFGELGDTDQTSTDVGLPDSADDIPPLGAAIRLMSGREVARNAPNSQGDSRRAEEVPQGAVLRSYLGLVDMWRQRVNEEAARLVARWPLVSS